MSVLNKIRFNVNAAYRNGMNLFKDKTVVSDALISPDRNGIRVVTLRFAANSGTAERLLHAFQTGEAELMIEDVAEV